VQGGVGYSFSPKIKGDYISAQKLESERSKIFLCLFRRKLKPSGARSESPGMENIPQVPGNRVEVGQNHNTHKAVSSSLSVLK